jgi:hypothetical protein
MSVHSRRVDARFDLSGRIALSVSGFDAEAMDEIVRLLRPFAPSTSTHPAVTLALEAVRPGALVPLVECLNPAGDGTTSGWDGAHGHLMIGRRRCRVPDVLAPSPAPILVEQGVPLPALFRRVIRPALGIAALTGGTAAIHATAVELDGEAILVAGWSESGKTEVALALMERGAHFLTDKWTLVGADGSASAFPIGVGVRRWVVELLPRLRAGLPARARAQLRVAAAADLASRPLRTGRAGAVGALAGRAVDLADRAALTPDEMHAIYGGGERPHRRLPIRAVVVLRTTTGGAPGVEPLDRGVAAQRLARTAAHERRAFLELGERAAYAAPGVARHDARTAVIAREEDLLAAVLTTTTVLEARTPFPADPRPIADALLAQL